MTDFALPADLAGPRGSAVAYLYAGLKLGATYDEVLAAAERERAILHRAGDNGLAPHVPGDVARRNRLTSNRTPQH